MKLLAPAIPLAGAFSCARSDGERRRSPSDELHPNLAASTPPHTAVSWRRFVDFDGKGIAKVGAGAAELEACAAGRNIDQEAEGGLAPLLDDTAAHHTLRPKVWRLSTPRWSGLAIAQFLRALPPMAWLEASVTSGLGDDINGEAHTGTFGQVFFVGGCRSSAFSHHAIVSPAATPEGKLMTQMEEPHRSFALVAHREAHKFQTSLQLWFLVQTAIWSAGIAAAAYFHVDIGWIALIGFVGVCNTIGFVVIVYGRRLDAVRAYLEQCCTETEETATGILYRQP